MSRPPPSPPPPPGHRCRPAPFKGLWRWLALDFSGPTQPDLKELKEKAAARIYDAMCWAVKNPPRSPPREVPWVKGGNSFAQDEARAAAQAVIDLFDL